MSKHIKDEIKETEKYLKSRKTVKETEKYLKQDHFNFDLNDLFEDEPHISER